MSIDTSEFLDVLMEDSMEALSDMNASLLELERGGDDSELVHAIFRGAHTIKGGCGMLGLEEIAGFTHLVETLLDQVREGDRQLDMAMVGLLLESVDALRGMFNALKDGGDNDAELVGSVKERLCAMLESRAPNIAPSELVLQEVMGGQEPEPALGAVTGSEHELDVATLAGSLDAALVEPAEFDIQPETQGELADNGVRSAADDFGVPGWAVQFVPDHDLFLSGYDPLKFVGQLAELGRVDVKCDANVMPAFARINPELCYLAWDINIVTDADADAVRAVFKPVINQCELVVEPLQEAHARQLRAIIAEQEASRKEKSGQDALSYLRETVVGELDRVESREVECTEGLAVSMPGQALSEREQAGEPACREGAIAGGAGSAIETRAEEELRAQHKMDSGPASRADEAKRPTDSGEEVLSEVQAAACDRFGVPDAEDIDIERRGEAEQAQPSQGMQSTIPEPPVMSCEQMVRGEKNTVLEEAAGAPGERYAISICNQNIDTLINVIGELVYTQARLAQLREKLEDSGLKEIERLQEGVAQLERDAVELQGVVIGALKS